MLINSLYFLLVTNTEDSDSTGFASAQLATVASTTTVSVVVVVAVVIAVVVCRHRRKNTHKSNNYTSRQENATQNLGRLTYHNTIARSVTRIILVTSYHHGPNEQSQRLINVFTILTQHDHYACTPSNLNAPRELKHAQN